MAHGCIDLPGVGGQLRISFVVSHLSYYDLISSIIIYYAIGATASSWRGNPFLSIPSMGKPWETTNPAKTPMGKPWETHFSIQQ